MFSRLPLVFACSVALAAENPGFESGTLAGWTATGDAFAKQPIQGDTVAKRRSDMRSRHAGEYWIGTYEGGAGDDLMGTLTSAPFKAEQPWASFLVGGGSMEKVRVEIVTRDDGKVFHTARGTDTEDMARSVVDLRKIAGRELFIRLVDEQKGGWGHLNFDDFLFHAEEPKFPNVIKASLALKADEVTHAGLSPDEAVKAATLAPGFTMTVFAAEPDIVNPIAFTIDERGRLWVAEGLTYPKRAKDGEGQDRILVFEDTDGDGRHDRRTVFAEKLNLVSGLEVGFGGVWVGAAPYLQYIPIAEGDAPRPAGEPKTLLDGWGYQDTHETLNTFRWGPDGWLYGCHGVFTHSNVGKPGAPDAERRKINAGFWRYHPTRHEFEVFAEGTSNPWGIDFDQHGQLFAEACVIPHLFHVIQGARYQRQAGQHFHPHTYDDLKTIADHRHYLGANPHGGNNKSDAAGGGHAHAGLVIPQHPSFGEWNGRILMGNIHGQRINADLAEAKGSGFVGKHGPDFLNFNDRASQVVDIRQGPNGTLFMIDWYDLQQCHRADRNAHEYAKGRIYRIARGKTAPVNLATKTHPELSHLAVGDDAWARTTARRLLQERKPTPASVASISGGGVAPPEKETPDRQVRGLWVEHAIGATSDGCLGHWLKNGGESARAWAIRLAVEDRAASPELRAEFARLAREDRSPVVALALLSAAPRLPLDQRRPILEPLLARADFADDPNLPLMLWWAIEPLVASDPTVAAELLGQAKLPRLQEFIARRLAATAGK